MNRYSVSIATLNDSAAIISVAVESGLFPESETGLLEELLADHFGLNVRRGRFCLLREADIPIGVAYYEPARATDRAWHLIMIGVRRELQGQGLGTALLRQVEESLRADDQRLLLVETSGLPDFRRTRDFYAKHGYEEEARIRDFWAAGDDSIVYRKVL